MRAVILLSGGMDSVTLLHYVAKRQGATRIEALAFNYGQKHARELEMAAWQCQQFAAMARLTTIDLTVLGQLTGAVSALTGATAVPDLDQIADADRDQPVTYVPNRNLVMLSLAAAHAEGCACETVYYGAQAHDEYGYWDCTTTFVSRLNQVLQLNRRQPITVEAPFIGMSKSDELQLGLELGVDYSHTWSCYRGQDLACGDCPTCCERRRAFAEVGVPDPLPYRQT